MNDHRVHRAGDIEFGITEAISLATVKSGISFAGGAARSTAKVIKSLTPNKGSIAKMARDYVMQFPVLASSSIPEEDLAPIVKTLRSSMHSSLPWCFRVELVSMSRTSIPLLIF